MDGEGGVMDGKFLFIDSCLLMISSAVLLWSCCVTWRSTKELRRLYMDIVWLISWLKAERDVAAKSAKELLNEADD